MLDCRYSPLKPMPPVLLGSGLPFHATVHSAPRRQARPELLPARPKHVAGIVGHATTEQAKREQSGQAFVSAGFSPQLQWDRLEYQTNFHPACNAGSLKSSQIGDFK